MTDNLERIVVMGGSDGAGNMTPVAEFNVWQDPEAAAIVTSSGVPLTTYGLDVFTRLVIDETVTEAFASGRHPAQRTTGGLLARRRSRTGKSGEYSGVIGGTDRGQAIVDQRVGGPMTTPPDPGRGSMWLLILMWKRPRGSSWTC